MRQILHCGVSTENDESLNRKIKLHNLIVLFICSASLTYVPMHLYFNLYPLMGITFTIFATGVLCFGLQSRKKHRLGFSVLTFGMIFIMTQISMTFGLVLNTHFFLLCACMTSIVFFDEQKRLRIFIFCVALAAFFSLVFFMPAESQLTRNSALLASVIKIYGYANFFVIFAFTTVFFTSFVNQNSVFQKKILTQNSVLELKNLQITDSLKYAKHIQNAILPSVTAVKEYLNESFILFKPKDIVAGDFYWMHASENGEMLFAAADSTGHGVPGAMVSVICTNALNQAVKEFALRDPGQILDKVRELVSNSFQQSDHDEVKDGMDISLCLIDKDKRIIKWAGANNPLWIIRENSEELEVIKPNKQSVSKTDSPVPFTTHTIQLHPGDCFYLFTDGYADQFGGTYAKKYMQKRMKKLLLSIFKKTMSTQKKLISDNLVHWMGKLEQGG